jgi:hypothetical protein
MITVTVGDILDDKGPEWQDAMGHRLYMVRDGEVVFYIGQSGNPLERILTHIGQGPWNWSQGPSPLGDLIMANLPASRGWQVDLMTPDECKPLVEDWLGFKITCSDIAYAEKALIRQHRPCLNVVCNEYPAPLPERYCHDDREVERAAANLLHVPYRRRGGSD